MYFTPHPHPHHSSTINLEGRTTTDSRLDPNTLPPLPYGGLNDIRAQSQIRLQQTPQTELSIHHGDHPAVRVDVAACPDAHFCEDAFGYAAYSWDLWCPERQVVSLRGGERREGVGGGGRTLRIGKSCMNAMIALASLFNSNCPLGLFLSEHICPHKTKNRHSLTRLLTIVNRERHGGRTLASIRVVAIPALIVSLLAACTSARIFCTHSSGST